MPVGVIGWRAGIASGNSRLTVEVSPRIPVTLLLCSAFRTYAYMYLFIWISVFALPMSVLISSLSACLHSFVPFSSPDVQNLTSTFMKLFSYFLVTVCFICSLLMMLMKSALPFLKSSDCQKKLMVYLQFSLYYLLTVEFLDYTLSNESFNPHMLLLLCGDIETNPGPQINCCLKLFHWNLNSICARGSIKIPLIEAYNSIHHFDLFAVSESMLSSEIKNQNISIEGFSKDVFRSDHPSNSRIGGVCVYFREDLPIKRRQDLELLQEMVVAEINLSRKKVFL